MKLSEKAQAIVDQITSVNAKLGDLRKIAKSVKKDHQLAIELWSVGKFYPMMLAILILDPKQLTVEVVDQLLADISTVTNTSERNQLTDWLMANQLLKDKRISVEIESWENDASVIKRRIFWYSQGRKRWMGQTSPENTLHLVKSIEKSLEHEHPDVQWAMNFTAGWIGIYDELYREKLIELGRRIRLYKEQMVSRNCTPNYLPEFISIEVKKRNT